MSSYRVLPGESTRSIARKLGVSTSALVGANPGKKTVRHRGEHVFANLRSGELLGRPSALGRNYSAERASSTPRLLSARTKDLFTQAYQAGTMGCSPATTFVFLSANEGACVLDTSSWPAGTPIPQGPCGPGYVPGLLTAGPRRGQYTCIAASWPGMPRPGSAPNAPPPAVPSPPPVTFPGWPDAAAVIAGLPVPALPPLGDVFPALPQIAPPPFVASGNGVDTTTGMPIPGTTPGSTPDGMPIYDPRLLGAGAVPSGTQSPEGAAGFLPAPSPPPTCSQVWPGAFPVKGKDGFVYCAMCDGEGSYSEKLGFCLPPGVSVQQTEALARYGAIPCGNYRQSAVGFDPNAPLPACAEVIPGSIVYDGGDGCVYCGVCEDGMVYDPKERACVPAAAPGQPEPEKTSAPVPAPQAGVKTGTVVAIAVAAAAAAALLMHLSMKKKAGG